MSLTTPMPEGPVSASPLESVSSVGSDGMRAVGAPAARLERPVRRWLICLGVLLGVFAAWSPGTVAVLALVALSAVWLARRSEPGEGKFLVRIFLIGFAVRALLSLGLDVGARFVEGSWPRKHGAPNAWDVGVTDQSRAYVKMGDSDYISQRGYATAQFARGNTAPGVVFRTEEFYGRNGYAYIIGAFYYLFDFSPSAIKLLNCFFGAWLGPLIFWLARACFNTPVARWTGAAVAFLPSLILWSTSNLKDPLLALLTALLFQLALMARRSKSLWVTALIAGTFLLALGVHISLRSAVYSLTLAGCIAAAPVVIWCLRRRWRILACGAVLVGALWVHPLDLRPGLASAFFRNVGHFTTPGTSYYYLPEAFYSPGYVWQWAQAGSIDGAILSALGRAVGHYLLEPLPLRLDNMFTVIIYPQVIAWYLVLPFAFWGIWSALRQNIRDTLAIVLTMPVWIFIGALTNGNVGTVFRIRDMITPFMLIFACAQIWRLTAQASWRPSVVQTAPGRTVSGPREAPPVDPEASLGAPVHA